MSVNKIVNISKYRDDNSPTSSGECRCLLCGYTWTGVVPIGTIWLECGECHSMKGRFVYHCERDRSHWTCNCGNDLFFATPEGFYCPNCGDWQKGF